MPKADGKAGASMRFDLVDLQLFIAVADARSITGGAERAHLALASASERIKGLEDALGVALFRRVRRGVELTAAGESLLDHARLVMHHVEAMRGDLASFASGVRASVQLLANTVGLSEHLPRALAAFLREHALPDNVERFVFGEDRLALVAARRSKLAGRRQIDFHEVAGHVFVGLTNATALQVHIGKHAARLGMRLHFRARLRDFDPISGWLAADVGIAV